MRHLKKKYRLAGGKDQRRALLRSLAISLIDKKEVVTTITKAKVLKAYFDKLVTLAKKTDLHHKRLLISRLANNSEASFKLIEEIIPRLTDRISGYTTLKRLNPRQGDNTLMARIKILLKPESKTISQQKDNKLVKPSGKKTGQSKADKKPVAKTKAEKIKLPASKVKAKPKIGKEKKK